MKQSENFHESQKCEKPTLKLILKEMGYRKPGSLRSLYSQEIAEPECLQASEMLPASPRAVSKAVILVGTAFDERNTFKNSIELSP